MLRVRKASDRGHANHGWLDTYHTFSFSSYYDPEHMGFRSLRVMNEDWVAPGKGFGTHPHDNMEIVTYVLEGALEHKDSMGYGEVLRPGEFQRITAGTGITHSEFNPSATEATHLYQIWLLPEARDLEPSYEQKRFDDQAMRNQLKLVASPAGVGGALAIHQDAQIYLAKLDADAQVKHEIPSGRHAWLQVLRGSVTAADQTFDAGDGLAVSDEPHLTVQATSDAEVMLFDLA
ncbi:pirin family protein [Aeoliella sp.]|uniref:pirin family protein n=1 Tax=Aeoliella sp. TaxID=2795800 RepID=UPI003CCC1B51